MSAVAEKRDWDLLPPDPIKLSAELCRRSFTRFCKEAWHTIEERSLVWNWHHDVITEHLELVVNGEIKRLVMNVPPRTSKSTFTSVLLQPWVWTDRPDYRFLTMSYAEELAIRDALRSRDVVNSEWYQARYGHLFQIRTDQNQKKRYKTTRTGARIVASVDSRLTGDGGDILLIDDPHNMRDIHSEVLVARTIKWFDNVVRSRFEDPAKGAIVIIAQRGAEHDLCGHVLKTREEDGWVHLSIPMEYDKKAVITTRWFRDPRKEKDELLQPTRFPVDYIAEMKRHMTRVDYASQYQQTPIAEGGNILPERAWRKWKSDQPPVCSHVVQFLDTAFEESEEAAWSARTTWGAFEWADEDGELEQHLILLEALEERLSYDDLRKEVRAGAKIYQPDYIFVERKASGISLVQDLRKAKLPVRGVKVVRDKVARAHLASLLLEQRRVWYMDRDWARDVIRHCAAFPRTDHLDIVDTVTMALNWLRLRANVELPEEREDSDLEYEHKVNAEKERRSYYG